MNEKISALMDCEVESKEISALVDELLASGEQQGAWYSMHAVRDGMQQQCPLSPDFMAKFSARLAQEPVIISPNRLRKTSWIKLLIPVGAVASVMFVGLAVWQFSIQTPLPQLTALAKAETPVILSSEISPYLAAHREGLTSSMVTEQFALANFEAGEQR